MKWTDADDLMVRLSFAAITVYLALARTADYFALSAARDLGVIPYSVLWTWLNPLYWTDLPYRLYALAFLISSEALLWQFVRRGRLPRFLFYLGWMQNMVWMSGTSFQNVTVTALAPLAAVYPVFAAFILLQKVPWGWSWPPWSSPNWQCAFNGTQTQNGGILHGLPYAVCQTSSLRLDVFAPWFWSYLLVLFWLAFPPLWWLLGRAKK